jgi:hypothetical protein
MTRVRPGWLLAIAALALTVSAWLPWLTTSAGGGGRGSAAGGTVGNLVLPPRFGPGQLIVLLSSVLIVLGAMSARGISGRLSAAAAVVLASLVAVLTWGYYRVNVVGLVQAGYGLYLGAGFAAAALLCALWALANALLAG